MSDSAGPTVVVVDEQHAVEIEATRWQRLAGAALAEQGVAAGELNLLFVDEPEISALNEAHMGKTGPTDVLSFPLDGAASSTPDSMIGDIVICPAVAARNAPEHAGIDDHAGSFDDELALLVVHGVLHLLGFDHLQPADASEMEAIEQQLLTAHHR